MEKTHKSQMRRKLDDLIARQAFEGKIVLAFGQCSATEEMLDYLFAKGIGARAVLDNNQAKQGQYCCGVPILPPQAVKAYGEADSVVLIAARFYEEMAAQLKGLHYSGEIIKVVDYNSFAAYSLSDETFQEKKTRMLRGAFTLERIRARYPDHHLVVCPYDALGDVYWAMAFLPAYCAKKGIEKTAVVVTGEGCLKTAGLFGTRDVIALEHAQMDEFVQALIFVREDNCIIAHHDRPYTDNIIRYLDRHFLSFVDYYRYGVYGLDKEAAPAKPCGGSECACKDALVKGRTVILAPHAKSVAKPPDVWWEALAREYHEKGYLMLTNVHGGEAPVRGTKALLLPIDQMISAAEYAGFFIGLRSGLCDILDTARCEKAVVFTDCIYSTTGIKADAFFDLPGWQKILWRP